MTVAEAVRRERAGGRAPRAQLRMWLAAAAVIACIAYLLIQGMTNSLVYFHTVPGALAKRAQLGGSYFRLEGTVVKGSIRKVPGGVDFSVAGGGREVSVLDRGNPPQLFAAGIPVVLEGHFLGNGNTFWSNQILVKHSSSYIAAHPNRVKGDPKA